MADGQVAKYLDSHILVLHGFEGGLEGDDGLDASIGVEHDLRFQEQGARVV